MTVRKSREQDASPETSAAEVLPGDAPEQAQDATNERTPSLTEQLETALAERDTHYDRLLRLQAELENFRKRMQREMEQSRQYQALPLARDLLPVLDNLRRALGAAEAAGNAAELVEGVNMVVKQFEDVLARHLVVPIEAVGQPFDAHLHEAVQQVPSPDHPPMTVVAEVERGYLLHDRVVRPAKVIVSSGPPV
jgi:molecular chaperone GrpE